MKQFAALFEELDQSTSTKAKVAALVAYFQSATADDAAWAVYFLAGGKPRRTLPTQLMRQVAIQASGLPDWLFEESYQAVGDLAETISLVLPQAVVDAEKGSGKDLAWWMTERILPLRNLSEEDKLASVIDSWRQLPTLERFLFVKLVGGGFRVGVSKLLVTRALAAVAGVDAKVIAARMMGYTDKTNLPDAHQYACLIAPEDESASQTRNGQPMPFFLAHPLQEEPETLGDLAGWLVEWKYDGIRAQVVADAGKVWIWSRGEELISEQFPELLEAFANWPEGSALDGEILVWEGNKPSDFNALQGRLNRKVVSPKLRKESPVVFLAYDCLRQGGEALTDKPLSERRGLLEAFIAHQQAASAVDGLGRLHLSEAVQADGWDALKALRQTSRARGVEGFMLKELSSRYGVGRTKVDGLWWKWKIDPMSIDCILVYAQRGHGRRASLYTDYTFAVWDAGAVSPEEAAEVCDSIARGEKVADTAARGLPRLVPFAKAYSGLTDEEFKRIDREIRKNTVDKFGPVRTVKPSVVMELGFEAIGRSTRHKSGVAVRFPRMLRIRDDKPLHEADTLDSLTSLLTDEHLAEAPKDLNGSKAQTKNTGSKAEN